MSEVLGRAIQTCGADCQCAEALMVAVAEREDAFEHLAGWRARALRLQRALELAHALCLTTAPKQSIGEVLATALGQGENPTSGENEP